MKKPNFIKLIRKAKQAYEQAGGIITPVCAHYRNEADAKAKKLGYKIEWHCIKPSIFKNGIEIEYKI